MVKTEVPRTVGMFQVVGGSRKLTHSTAVDSGVDPWVLVQASDMVLCTDRRAGFKMAAAMGMSLSKPVMCRELPSLREIGVPDVSMEFFSEDGDGYYQILDLLSAPVYMESLGMAARSRAEDYLSLDRSVENFARMIRDSVGRR
jgi:hypothetical protein